MSDLPMKQEDHPSFDIPSPTEEYKGAILSGYASSSPVMDTVPASLAVLRVRNRMK